MDVLVTYMNIVVEQLLKWAPVVATVIMAVFTYLQFRINRRQENNQKTETSICYCRNLIEFFSEIELDWTKKREKYNDEIKKSFKLAIEEQKENLSLEKIEQIQKDLDDRFYFGVISSICDCLELTGINFERFLFYLLSHIINCYSEIGYLLKAMEQIDLSMLNFHQSLLLQQKIKNLVPISRFSLSAQNFSFNFHEPYINLSDGWFDEVKEKSEYLSKLLDVIESKIDIMNSWYSDECTIEEKEKMKVFFQSKTDVPTGV